MKISDSQPAAPDPTSRTEETGSSKKGKADETSPFSQLMAKKKGNIAEDTKSKGDAAGQFSLDPSQMGILQGQPTKSEFPIQTAQVESKQPVALPVELQQLVREISVVVNTSGKQEVHIEMNSQVLKGLHIQIERNQGAIAIQFQSNSAQVTDLLQKNVTVLSQALTDKGMSQPTIRVSGPGDSSSTGDYKSGPQSTQRGQGGRQGGGR